jgi:hypothetical protein
MKITTFNEQEVTEVKDGQLINYKGKPHIAYVLDDRLVLNRVVGKKVIQVSTTIERPSRLDDQNGGLLAVMVSSRGRRQALVSDDYDLETITGKEQTKLKEMISIGKRVISHDLGISSMSLGRVEVVKGASSVFNVSDTPSGWLVDPDIGKLD